MIPALVKAFQQLDDPRLRRVLLLSFGASLVLFVVLVVVVSVILGGLDLIGISWLDSLVAWLGGIATAVLALLLFPAVLGIVISLFLDEVAEAVEARHYPDLPKAPGQGFWAGLWSGIAFAGLLIGVNLLLLVAYAVMALTVILAPLIPVLFYVVNGRLVGREYFEQVAFRRYETRTVKGLRQAHAGRIWIAGMIIALIAVVPILNLIAPVLATAFMVHILQDVARANNLTPKVSA